MSKIKTFKKFVCELTNNTLPQELVIVTEVDKVYFNNKDLLQVTKLFKYFNENNISKYNKYAIPLIFYLTKNNETLACTEECAICMNNLRVNIVKLNCDHVYHYNCIHKWKKIKNTCPLCMTSIAYKDFYLENRISDNVNKLCTLYNKVEVAHNQTHRWWHNKTQLDYYYLLYQLVNQLDINLTYIESRCLYDSIKSLKNNEIKQMNKTWENICKELSWKYKKIK